jgi:tetratricopeptide (TPR) repeat protein
MKQLVYLKSIITPFAKGAMRCPPSGPVFLLVAHLLACVALAPVAQACTRAPDAWATYVASYSFTANWSRVSGGYGYRLDVSTSSSFNTYVPGYQNLNVGNTTSRSVTGLNASTTYYFRVSCTGRYSNTVRVMTLSPTGLPVVITNPATLLANFSATLNGSVDPHGLTTTVYFQYGRTISYGLTTATQSETGNAYQHVAANIGGLAANTTYHFRIVATNGAGTRYGADRTFTTLGLTGSPVVITNPATLVAGFSATLNGSVNPHGLTTNVYFQYGITINYGLFTANQSKTGNAYQHVAANISGLAANTTYHFRIVATNSAGTRYGADRTFTTHGAEQGLALDPGNMDQLAEAAATYAMLRQFPVALKLFDRAPEVIPNDPELIALKATIYQAKGNLQEAAKLLSDVNERTTSGIAFEKKLTQLRLERNHAEAIRLLQARRTQTPSACGGFDMLYLIFAQRLVGDTAGAKATAEQTRNTLEPLCKEQPDIPDLEVGLALADAVLGQRDSALKEAERAIMLAASAKDDVHRAGYEEILALIHTVLGENSRAISTLTQLLKTPYGSHIYGPAGVTPDLLRLDPIWDPLRSDPVFQKLCEEKQP